MVQVLLDPGGSQPPSNPFSAYDPIYDEVSKETGVPAAILKAQTMQESRFNPEAIGRSGEVGLLQIKPSTAAQPGYGLDPVDPTKLADPAENIRFGARYLAARARDAGVQDWNDPQQVAKGLAAYNGGGDPNYAQNVFRHLKPPGGAQPQQAAPQAPQPANPWGAPAQQPAQASEPFAVRDISHLGQFNWGKIEKPEGIVIHHTGGRGTPEGIMNVFKQRGLATQYIMDRDGNVHRALPEGAKGRHLKPSEINGLSNSNAIGIEIIAKDDSDLTDAQRASAAKWLAATQSKYNIPAANVFGHGEVNSHKQRTEGSTIVSAWRAANGIEGVPSVNIARAQSIGQPLNPTVTAAAERGRGPAADRPARAAAYVEGQMPMARRQMVDTTSADNAGVLEFLRQQAGMGQETMPVETAQGGLGGLGGFRIPGATAPAAPAPSGPSAAAQPVSVESLIPAAPRDPFAIIGKGAAQNQEWAMQRQGRIAIANFLVSKGMPIDQAVAASASPQAVQLFMQDKQRAESTAFDREKFDFQKENARADNKRADDAAMSAPRKILRDLQIEPGHPEYIEQYKRLAGLGNGASAEVEQRKKDAASMGMKPDDPGFKSYVLTGKMPREDAQPLSATDKKAIMESDEGVMAAESAIKALREAKTLSPKALGGVGAGWKAAIANNLWDGVVPDGIIGSPEQGKATVEMENLVTSNALSQMKAIFGGNPTEGERKILLDIQGSANMPDRIRQPIFDRAIALAERRLEFNKQRAGELRGNTYYKPGDKQAQTGAPAAVAPAPSQTQQPAAVPDRAALEAEARRRKLIP